MRMASILRSGTHSVPGALKRRLKRLLPRSLFPTSRPRRKRDAWSIGIFAGESLLHLAPARKAANPVLTFEHVTDIPARIVADPFMLKVDGDWHMFFEVMHRRTHRGQIGLATSRNGLKWKYRQIVLVEPFHLSYPYVFEWMGEFYMIPESHKAGSIRLYRAAEFPTQWSFVKTLLEGHGFADSSILRHAGKWWLFTETGPDYRFDTLRLYYADDLLGPWIEHPRSPIVDGNAHVARPGGRVLVADDRIIRYAQDCVPVYGTQVRAFEITELSTTGYREREVGESPILAASGKGWNHSGMHHVDPHRLDDGSWIACVDGWISAHAAN